MKQINSFLLLLLFLIPNTFIFARVDLLVPDQNPYTRVVYNHSTDESGNKLVTIKLVSRENCTGSYQCYYGYRTRWTNYSYDATYRGCGRHAANHFTQWYGQHPSMHNTRAYVKGTEFHKPGFNPIFTTPAQLSVGLEKLIRAYRPATSYSTMEEINVIRHYGGGKSTLIEQFEHHLKRGTPVIALINDGNHWVMVTSMSYKKSKSGSYSNVEFEYSDNKSNSSATYSQMDLRNWDWDDSFLRWVVDVAGYSSYKEGTLVSLKTDKIVYEKKWSKGWSGNVFNVIQSNGKNRPYLMLFKPGNGTVHIRNVSSNGSVGSLVETHSWSNGWTHMKAYSVGKKSFMFLLKAGTGEVHIHNLNYDGTIGTSVKEYDWSSGWQNVAIFKKNGVNYLLLNKVDGLTHLHRMNSNGTVGARIVKTAHGFMSDVRDIGVVSSSSDNLVHFYGVSPITGKYRHAYHSLVTGRNFSHIESKNWSKNWTQVETFDATSKNKCLLIAKAGVEVPRLEVPGIIVPPHNGLVHVRKFNSNHRLGELVDTNYFKNVASFYGISKAWSNMQYFRAPNGELRLLMMDSYSGNVRILKMNDDCSFQGGSDLLKVLKN